MSSAITLKKSPSKDRILQPTPEVLDEYCESFPSTSGQGKSMKVCHTNRNQRYNFPKSNCYSAKQKEPHAWPRLFSLFDSRSLARFVTRRSDKRGRELETIYNAYLTSCSHGGRSSCVNHFWQASPKSPMQCGLGSWVCWLVSGVD